MPANRLTSDRSRLVKISYSRHAKRQMKWRRISAEDVETTVLDPDRVEDSIRGRKNAFKELGSKYLKVTYVEREGQYTIVTAVDKNQ